jgi:signal transduction histidine kinase
MRLPRSLFGQVMLSQVLLMLIFATALPLVLSHLLHTTADRFVAERLMRDATAIAAGREPWVHQDGAHGETSGAIYHGPHGRRYAVFDARGHVVRQGPRPLPLAFAAVRRDSSPAFSQFQRFDVLSMPAAAAADGSARWVVVAQDRTVPEEIVDDVVRSFVARFIWVVPVSLLASLLIGLAVVRRVTNNFRRAATAADAISLHRIDRRLDPDMLPSEAAPLVTATNRALDRLEAGYRFQGEFVGNVAHELRTPLALISLRAEGLDESPERDLIQIGVERANHVVRQLMELAAIDRHYPEMEPIDPCSLAQDVVSVMAPLVFRADHDIAFVAPDRAPPNVRGVPGLIQIALTNLIDNAIRHTPAGSTITVSVEQDGRIVVADDGPGLAVDAGDDSRHRYRREGTRRSDSAGLGLAIVERIMTACEGSLSVGNGPAGGARLSLTLMPVA